MAAVTKTGLGWYRVKAAVGVYDVYAVSQRDAENIFRWWLRNPVETATIQHAK